MHEETTDITKIKMKISYIDQTLTRFVEKQNELENSETSTLNLKK